ncbi:TPA: hypothetical protein ACU0L0_001868 [Streptococcus suis]|uniref:Uncharacterized protein n=1 Tax=Streptococcus suis TaxID=1307 RepID=A0A123SZ72_STRSU|nr:hypothetical protein [Streptococcus suis]MBY4974413.1 hypothetical protein [Streptococcus suis]MCK3895335.1 hypothetical protein [Streptococcus suis]NQH35030.1 hypothetical protein [Streptococcus suis]NQK55158.1 hypothetical protein [Streptococcus suis]NQM04320.1 hypothetical protein [Streptococcus suis]
MNILKTIVKHRHFRSLLVGLGAGAIICLWGVYYGMIYLFSYLVIRGVIYMFKK